MADNFSYLSILNPGFPADTASSSDLRAGKFAYVSFLNPPPITGGTGGTGGAPASYFSNANNVFFGTNGSVVTAIATFSQSSQTWGHVAAPRSAAWEELGIRISSASPSDPIHYTQWLAGSTGHWGWIEMP